MDEAEIALLVGQLQDARDAAARVGAGAEVAGVRAVEPRAGERWYLCALADARFVVLDADLAPAETDDDIRHVAAAALFVEAAEALVDPAELTVLRAVAGRVAGASDEPEVRDAAGALSDAAALLAGWRDHPMRAVASVAALDDAVAAHDGARRAYETFVAATDHLVPIQDTLSPALQRALRELDQACAAGGLPGTLGGMLAPAMERALEGAGQIVAASIGR